jgi:DNA modification methylase
MLVSETSDKHHFADFEIEPVLFQQDVVLSKELKNHQTEQLKIFYQLEQGVSMCSAPSLGNQVHFQNAYQTPIQRWFPYREGYSTRLVNAFLKELHIHGDVFDPFSGSGTTLLAARQKNLNSFGVDVNPISVLVARVKNENYTWEDIENLKEEINNLRAVLRSGKPFSTAFMLAEKVFNEEILQSLLQLKFHIRHIQNVKIQNLFFVAWLSIIEEVSNIKKEGNGIKYKNRKRTSAGYITINKQDWEQQVFPEDKFSFVKNKLVQHLTIILHDITENFGESSHQPKIFQGSCLNFDEFFSDEIQFTFFSPPYCNCFDYFEIHKVDLWLGDFIKNKEEFRALRSTGFRSNTNSLNRKPVVYKNEHLEKLIALFDANKLWNEKIPNVVRGYFDDTHTLLKKLYQQTVPGGYVGIVVGNSAYAGVIIPTDTLVADIAREIGFSIKNIFITRHLTTSSQQKQHLAFLKNYLRESIVLLQK